MRFFHFLLFVSGVAAVFSRAEAQVRYFDYPENQYVILSRGSTTSPMDAMDPSLRIRVDRNARFTVRQVDPNGSTYENGARRTATMYRGDVEWIDDKGRKQVLRDVYVPAQDTREKPIIGRETPVNGLKSGDPKENCDPLTKQVQSIKNAVGLKSYKMGECLPTPPSGNLFHGSLGKKYEAIKAGPPIFGNYHGRAVYPIHAYAIESLARTIYGEMRGCLRKGNRYGMAVARVVHNRAIDIQKHGLRESYVNPKSAGMKEELVTDSARTQMKMSSTMQIIPHLFEANKQFSVWNRGDANNRAILCPDLNSKEWQTSLDIASAAVLKDPEFMKATDDVKVRHYTSGMEAPWKGLTEQKNVSVGGLPVDDPKCLRFWNMPPGK